MDPISIRKYILIHSTSVIALTRKGRGRWGLNPQPVVWGRNSLSPAILPQHTMSKTNPIVGQKQFLLSFSNAFLNADRSKETEQSKKKLCLVSQGWNYPSEMFSYAQLSIGNRGGESVTSIDHYDEFYVNLLFDRSIYRPMCTHNLIGNDRTAKMRRKYVSIFLQTEFIRPSCCIRTRKDRNFRLVVPNSQSARIIVNSIVVNFYCRPV